MAFSSIRSHLALCFLCKGTLISPYRQNSAAVARFHEARDGGHFERGWVVFLRVKRLAVVEFRFAAQVLGFLAPGSSSDLCK